MQKVPMKSRRSILHILQKLTKMLKLSIARRRLIFQFQDQLHRAFRRRKSRVQSKRKLSLYRKKFQSYLHSLDDLHDLCARLLLQLGQILILLHSKKLHVPHRIEVSIVATIDPPTPPATDSNEKAILNISATPAGTCSKLTMITMTATMK